MLSLLSPDYSNQQAVQAMINTLIAQPGNGAVGWIEVAIPTNSAAGVTFTVPYNCKLLQVQAIASATNALGTLGLNAPTSVVLVSPIACAVLDTITAATVLISAPASRQLAVGTTYTVVVGGTTPANTTGVLQLLVERV